MEEKPFWMSLERTLDPKLRFCEEFTHKNGLHCYNFIEEGQCSKLLIIGLHFCRIIGFCYSSPSFPLLFTFHCY